MRTNLRWPVVIASSALLVAILTMLGASGPLLAVPALWFLLVCTGMAFPPLAGIVPRTPPELALVAVFSLVLDILVATVLTLAGGLSQTSGLLALILLSLVGCGLQLFAAPIRETFDPPKRLAGPAGPGAHQPLASPDR